MPDIIVTLTPASTLNRCVDAICALDGYQATLPGGGANPETRNAFAKRMVAEWIKRRTTQYEAGLAMEAARVAAEAAADALSIT